MSKPESPRTVAVARRVPGVSLSACCGSTGDSATSNSGSCGLFGSMNVPFRASFEVWSPRESGASEKLPFCPVWLLSWPTFSRSSRRFSLLFFFLLSPLSVLLVFSASTLALALVLALALASALALALAFALALALA